MQQQVESKTKIISHVWDNVAHVREVDESVDKQEVIKQIIMDCEARKNKTKSNVVELPKRSEKYTILKADGVGWWDVIAPDGKAITEKSMRKAAAKLLMEEKNGEAT